MTGWVIRAMAERDKRNRERQQQKWVLVVLSHGHVPKKPITSKSEIIIIPLRHCLPSKSNWSPPCPPITPYLEKTLAHSSPRPIQSDFVLDDAWISNHRISYNFPAHLSKPVIEDDVVFWFLRMGSPCYVGWPWRRSPALVQTEIPRRLK